MILITFRTKNCVFLGASIQMGMYSSEHMLSLSVDSLFDEEDPLTLKCSDCFFVNFFQSLVIAGLGDLSRPANQLSLGQSGSLLATGLIWSRYSLVIIPKNYSLFSVNVFVALTQIIQLYRAYDYSQKQKALEETAPKSTN